MEIYILIALVFFGLCIWLFFKLKKAKKQNQSLSVENRNLLINNALLEAEHLKFQLQPHTLNNILANLKVIANKLNKGMDSLSETLEYILYKGNNHLVSIEDEINFIKKYLELNDLFISEIDSIKVDYSQVNKNTKYFNNSCVPHLVTAYFIENAFKHGDVNHPQFLNIELKLNDKFFVMNVVNKIKQKPKELNSGLGLINMKKRLELFMPGKFEVRHSFNDKEYFSNLIIHF